MSEIEAFIEYLEQQAIYDLDNAWWIDDWLDRKYKEWKRMRET